ncbi:23S rRNA (uracil(1939)-C(5))-methyltransferase RlmD [Streptomyces microflavus]
MLGIESGKRAVEDARHNLKDLDRVRIEQGKVDQVLPRTGITECDLIVLDPPRAGAGKQVVKHLSGLGARKIAYVACDPAALAGTWRTSRGTFSSALSGPTAAVFTPSATRFPRTSGTSPVAWARSSKGPRSTPR